MALARTKSSFVVSAAVLTTTATRATHTPDVSCMVGSAHSAHAAAPVQRAQPVWQDMHVPVAVEAYSPAPQ